uniref:NADH-ubiquinone oxidoreductase chain 6 n=1 Tax=Anneissia intermedia TaxID=2819924 RepID=A0A8A6C3R1_9ECHI|nr:NADH dehydrogenase subunit 6 [Anneissia intermedia]QTH78852.1 NADH dehydrogenase subunit 6 [Anneissia intermedia]
MNIYLSIIFLLLGTSLVFYSMSPYFSALGLTIVSISSCFLLTQTGMNFFALILLLVYMGGMLIVFIYSSALSADRFPIISNTNEIIILCSFIILWTIFLFNNNNWNSINTNNISNLISIEGASYLFSPNFFLFFIFAAYILFITLIAVLNISNETESFTLRAL